ncbi:Ubiquitin carboxyl-terminal hydrolase 32, partial [Caligus rogercresseyi]
MDQVPQDRGPSDYLAAVPSMTLKRYKHLKVGPPHQNSSPELLNGGDSVLEEDDEVFEEDALPSGSSFASSSSANSNMLAPAGSLTIISGISISTDLRKALSLWTFSTTCTALSVTLGFLGGGHYTSYTKHFHKWYLNNDSTCK